MESIVIALAAGGLALLMALILAWFVLRQDEGSQEVRDIGELIREGI